MLTVTSLRTIVSDNDKAKERTWINANGQLVSNENYVVIPLKNEYNPNETYTINRFSTVVYYKDEQFIRSFSGSSGVIPSVTGANKVLITTPKVNLTDYRMIQSEQVYPLLAKKIVSSELNGNEDLELRIPQQKNNILDLLSIDKLWEFDYNNIIYKAVNIKRQTRGQSFNLNVRAMPLFYWEFSKSIIHENNDGSHTANSAFRTVFEGTGFNFVLVDFSPAVTIEGFGKGANRLELFKRLLDRYNYEFEIQGRTVYMKHLIGNDTNYMYKYKLNASNVSSTTDATEYFTHIKGFGNFEEGEEDYFNNAKLKREYTHPLADVVGKWEGPPIVDGRVTQSSALDETMAQAVEESLTVTIEGTLHDVRKIYDIAVPVKGDRVWLHDERINLEQEIRLHKIVTTYDEKDNIIACDVTFGSQSIGERHKANINSLSKRFADLLTGKLKLPVISLEQIGMDMINAIHAASSEIIFDDDGMKAISKTNPNHVFGVNSEGWYISQDGGRTPKTIATAKGIYADALFAGTLWLTNEMNIESADGYLNVTGSNFTMRSKTNSANAVVITPYGITVYGFDGRRELVNGIRNYDLDATLQQFYVPPYVNFSGSDMTTREVVYRGAYVCWSKFESQYFKLFGTVKLEESASQAYRYCDIQLTQVGTGTVIAERRIRSNRGETVSYEITVDMKEFFGVGFPDKRRMDFYINFKIYPNSPSSSDIMRLRANRVALYG